MSHIVITGGTGGLGRAISTAFHGAETAVESLGKQHLDLREISGISRYFENRPVDLLICAAGITCDAPLSRLDESSWDEVFAVNYKSAVACARAVLPQMRKQRAGHIVFISSFSALHPPIGQVAYATAKAALLGLTASLAQENGDANIRVNAILPGFLETRMTENVTEKRRAEILAAHSLNRFNTPEAVARFIYFLHHSLPHTSGQTFQLDSRIS
jgi:3-oxoacyl-[acyl-carrier protein] reductase